MLLGVLCLLGPAGCGGGSVGDDDPLPDGTPIDAPRGCEDATACDDLNPCTIDRCTGGVCGNEIGREDEGCNDGLDCTMADHCVAGVCTGAATDCSFLDEFCVVGACQEGEGGCVAEPRPDETTCDDGAYCTVSDVCTGGACGGTARDCTAAGTGACNVGVCDEATAACVASAIAEGEPCDDGVTCTGTSSCLGGVCTGGAPPACDDLDVCTTDSCDVGADACANVLVAPIAGAEGPAGTATCADGVDNDCDRMADLADPDCVDCLGPADCDDANDCTSDACALGVCVNGPLTGSACDDGLYCTASDTCTAGVCTPGPARGCADGLACTSDVCDEGANACTNPARGVDPTSPVGSSAGASICLVAGSGARAIAWADLRDVSGIVVTGAAVTIGGVPATESTSRPGTYFRELTAAGAPSSETLAVVATTCGATVTLAASIPTQHVVANAGAGGTGGCSPPGGNLRVRVVSAETGAAVAGARVLVGLTAGTPFQHAPESLFGGAGVAATNVGTSGADGIVTFRDYASALDGAITVTAGTDTRAYVTVEAAQASDVVLPLPLLHPTAPTTTLYDAGTSVASVANCSDLDVALLLPKIDLAFFSDLDLTRFFGKKRCWSSMNGNVGTPAVPENFWVPAQSIGPFCLGGAVVAAPWALTLNDTSATGVTESVGLLHVRIPLAAVTAVTADGAPFSTLLASTTYRGLGFLLGETVPTPPTTGRSIPVIDTHPNNFTITYGGKPTDTDVIGFVLGDHAGTNGTGPLFLIGHQVHAWDTAGSSVAIPNSDLDAAGTPVGSRRLATLTALYLDPIEHAGVAANRLEGVSTVLVRGGASAPFGATGGTGSITDFLDLSGQTYTAPGTFRWENATRNGNTPSYSRHDLVVRTKTYLPPLSCDPANDVRESEVVEWIVYRPFAVACGADECFTLPTLPSDFPRATTSAIKRSGFEALTATDVACTASCAAGACVDPDGAGPSGSLCLAGAGTAGSPYVGQEYRWRLHVYDLGLALGFDFDTFTFADHEGLLTHESANKLRID